jgi:hypothetical protein
VVVHVEFEDVLHNVEGFGEDGLLDEHVRCGIIDVLRIGSNFQLIIKSMSIVIKMIQSKKTLERNPDKPLVPQKRIHSYDLQPFILC